MSARPSFAPLRVRFYARVCVSYARGAPIRDGYLDTHSLPIRAARLPVADSQRKGKITCTHARNRSWRRQHAANARVMMPVREE